MLGPLFVDVEGLTLSPQEHELLRHPLVGGVVLFSRNYASPAQLTALVKEIKSLRSPELLVTVDHEGGRVQRFRDGFTVLPPMASFGEAFNNNPTATIREAEASAYTMASELIEHGIDISFAPVLDLNRGICKVLEGGRAISADVNAVVEIGKAYIQGMHRAGMPAIGKHFPGHGSVAVDSHVGIPHDRRSLALVEAEDMQTFRQLFDHGLDAVMPAHIIFPEVDELPVSLSPVWLTTLLREKYHYSGVIMSDCLSMKGAANIIPDPVARVEQALTAGCDVVLLCNDRAAQEQVLAKSQYSVSTEVATRLLNLRCYQGGK